MSARGPKPARLWPSQSQVDFAETEVCEMNPKQVFEPHLVVKHITLPPAGEWRPDLPGWVFARLTAGQAYAMHALKNQLLETGSVIAFPWPDRGYIRASQLDWASLHFFQVEPERLVGLVTLDEQKFLRGPARRNHSSPRVFPVGHPVSERFKNLCTNPKVSPFSTRLQLLEIFIEALGGELKGSPEETATMTVSTTDARARMAELLKQMPAAALLDLTLNELVTQVHCTPRHVSRLFNEVVGMSFRKKQSEVRLLRAQELLATTESKVLEVAMESGFQSVSLFNLMFKRRFGVTPGRWRERVRSNNPAKRRIHRASILKA
jgi:AraC-like DNA-binding protein